MGKIFKTALLCLALAGILTSLAACGRKTEEESSSLPDVSSYDVDVLQFAGQGQIPELPVKLGDSVGESQQETAVSGEEAAPETSSDTSDGEPGKILGSEAAFYYQKDKADEGISMLVSFGTSYGFQTGIAMPDDVKNAISDDCLEGIPTAEELFFLPATPDHCTRLRYSTGDYQLNFYFVDDFLSAVTLLKEKDWPQNGQAAASDTASAAS